MVTLYPADAMSDSYKVGMSNLHSLNVFDMSVEILSSYSNFTPRKNCFMEFSDVSDGKIVVYGTLCTFKTVDNLFRKTFFNVARSTAIKRIKRRLMAHFGSIEEHAKFIADMGKLHDLGYLPIEVRSIDEGTRYPIGLPLFTVKATVDSFGWLVNFIETLSSGEAWPMINTASKVEQFYLQARHYGNLSSSDSNEVDGWLPTCVHEFGTRGYRGMEDQVHTSSCSSLFFLGSDAMAVLDHFEEIHGDDIEEYPIALSVRATEHADISRMLSLFRHIARTAMVANQDAYLAFEGRQVSAADVLEHTELYVLEYFIRNTKGIFSYVADTEHYYRLLNVYASKLKDLIKSRSAREDGQPARFVFRPDSARRTPLTIICGYRMMSIDDIRSVDHASYQDTCFVDAASDEYFLWDIETSSTIRITKEEAQGSLISMWNIFGGDERDTPSGKLKFIDAYVSILYGEAISQTHQKEIYERAIDMGFSVTNILIGKGSYASLEGSTRDLFSMSYKQTFSVANIDGNIVNLAQQKKPMGDSTKTSARGLLCVDMVNGEYVLEQDVSEEREQQGYLTLLYRNGVFFKTQKLKDIIGKHREDVSKLFS